LSKFWDNWATAHRNTRAAAAVVALGLGLAWMWLADPGEPLARRAQTGIVEQVYGPAGEAARGHDRPICLVRLEDGKRTRIGIGPPRPKPGDRVPLVVETYADGSRRAYLDRDRWLGL
jgi:hypothetical protein